MVFEQLVHETIWLEGVESAVDIYISRTAKTIGDFIPGESYRKPPDKQESTSAYAPGQDSFR